jgi:hypothetical protein
MAYVGEGGALRIANGHYSYTFTPGATVRVLSSEWARGFPVIDYNGQPVLAVVSVISAAVKPSSSRRVILPDASHTDAPAQGASPAAATTAAEAEVK